MCGRVASVHIHLTQSVIADTSGNEFDHFISAMSNVLGTINERFCSDSNYSKTVILSKLSEINFSVDGKTRTAQSVLNLSVSQF